MTIFIDKIRLDKKNSIIYFIKECLLFSYLYTRYLIAKLRVPFKYILLLHYINLVARLVFGEKKLIRKLTEDKISKNTAAAYYKYKLDPDLHYR